MTVLCHFKVAKGMSQDWIGSTMRLGQMILPSSSCIGEITRCAFWTWFSSGIIVSLCISEYSVGSRHLNNKGMYIYRCRCGQSIIFNIPRMISHSQLHNRLHMRAMDFNASVLAFGRLAQG